MKKYILLIIILLTSCASRKVNVNIQDTKKDSIVKTETTTKVVTDIKKKDTTSIKTDISVDEIIIEPIDTTRPIYVNNVPYKNVILKIKKKKSNTLYTNSKTESDNSSKDSTATTTAKKTEHIYTKEKTIDKTMNYCWFIWWFILIIILYLLWKNKERLLGFWYYFYRS